MSHRKRIAIIDREKCHPNDCGNYLCAKLCPVNRAGADCIFPGSDTKARIDELLCTGCGICPGRCPFGAITIINLPETLDKDPIHRYGENLFELYSLPTPIFGKVTGILGRNGIGKSTAVKILAKIIIPNLGKLNTTADVKDLLQYFKGTEMQKFLEKLNKDEITFSYKPQQVEFIPKQFTGTVRELLQKADQKNQLPRVTEQLQMEGFLDNQISHLSGGELQRVAIAAAALKHAQLYLFDEPTSYLDIKQRINASLFVRSLATENTAVMAVEHDLIIFDYMTDVLNIVYGQENIYGIFSGLKTTREGINTFLDGYLKEENVRFRNHAIKFEKGQERVPGKPQLLLSWKNLNKKLGKFSLKTEEGQLHKNEIIGVLGENGIGKTTLVKILAGVVKEDDGDVSSNIKVAYKPQYLNTSADLLVAEFLERAIQKYSAQLIVPLDLEKLFTQKLSELSGGQLQRVAIAHCLSQDAELFLLDEPCAYLDVEQRLLISKIIKNVAEERESTILVVDHDLMFVDYVSDRLLVFSGTPAVHGLVQGPFGMQEGMNRFLKEMGITLRRDVSSRRPRINDPGSVKDREQRAEGKWYSG